MDERSAIRALKAGDIRGLEPLVEWYTGPAVRAAFLIVRDRAAAEDVVQDAFVRAYKHIRSFDDALPFGPWFMRITVNQAITASRRSRRSSQGLEGEYEAPLYRLENDRDDGPEQAAVSAEQREYVWRAMGALPPKHRAVVVMKYYLELSEDEISIALGVPRGTVKSRLHSARFRLRGLLTVQSVEEKSS